jgi:hypothetical protein
MRWLVVVCALAGLGLLQGGHCHDMLATATALVSPTEADDVVAPSFVAGAVDAALTAGPGHRHDRDGSGDPATTAEDCQPLVTTVVAATTVAVAPLPLVQRSSYFRSRPTLSSGRALPALALAALGVLRT